MKMPFFVLGSNLLSLLPLDYPSFLLLSGMYRTNAPEGILAMERDTVPELIGCLVRDVR
jgi:hypothetical protein